MKKLTAALCVVLLMICVFVPGAAAAGPALGATRAYCIIDADTGLVLAQQNMNEELHPASITKVMTLGLACEKAQGNWDDIKLTVTHEDVYSLAGTDSSHIALREGEEVPLTDALYATQMASANDGANLLAEYFGGGTIADGVAAMNAQVEELGLAHTHFSNPHGISDNDHYTSCYDMAQILRWALQQRLSQEALPPTGRHFFPDAAQVLAVPQLRAGVRPPAQRPSRVPIHGVHVLPSTSYPPVPPIIRPPAAMKNGKPRTNRPESRRLQLRQNR